MCAINPPTKPSTPRLVRGFFIGLLQATVPCIQGSSSEEDQALMPGARVSINVAVAISRKRMSGLGLSGDAKSLTVFAVGSIGNRFPLGWCLRISAFLKLSTTLDECAKRYERFCQRYRHHAKASPKCHWGSRMLKRLVSSARTRSKKKRVSPGQQRLPWAWDVRLNQIPEDWHQVAVKFRRANGIRDGDQTLRLW